MDVIRSRAIAAALGLLALAGCAGTHAAGGAGFSVSRAIDGHGAASPIAAARDFELHGDIPGYGTPASVWTVTARRRGAATLVSGGVLLHAVQMRDATWWIDSGERCG